MPLKIKNLNSLINTKHIALAICSFVFVNAITAQELIEETVASVKQADTTKNTGPIKVDGVAAVVGDYIVLDSDIDKTILQIEAQGGDASKFSRCSLFGKLLEDKLYAHHAIEDSVEVSDAEIRSFVDQQIQQFKLQFNGSLDEVLKFYNKEDEQSLRDEMFTINKNNKLAAAMQKKIVDEVEVTPEEVRQFFNNIPKEERPTFGTELKVAQIVIEPKVNEAEKQRVIKQLNEIRDDVLKGASFLSKVIFYTDDTASKKDGGMYTLNRKRPQMVKEFREVAFALQEGEISKPFATEYGYHIIYLEKIRGQEYDVRHILIIPKVSETEVMAAKTRLEDVKKKIENNEISFADAAREMSDEKETKFQGGQLINPATQDYNFELTKMDPELYGQIQDLKDNQISEVLTDEGRTGKVKFKILKISDRINEHEADYARDYLKIKELALNEKRFKAIDKWQNEKIMDTYIKISDDKKDCDFNSNWLKK
ncbi:peptidylprolyl isomerase [Lacinutrix salivirga]